MARDEQLTTYVSEEEKQAMRIQAVKEGYSGVSGWLRDLALDELEDADINGGNGNEGNLTTAQTAD